MKEVEIGRIGNYYGGLHVRKTGDLCEWSIENWDGHHWEQIPKSLYDELIRFESTR